MLPLIPTPRPLISSAEALLILDGMLVLLFTDRFD